jgi:hypothetical protein
MSSKKYTVTLNNPSKLSFKLEQEDDEVVLKTDDGLWNILKVTRDGNIKLFSSIEKALGLKVDSKGRVEVIKED